jgi:hypothetical protein
MSSGGDDKASEGFDQAKQTPPRGRLGAASNAGPPSRSAPLNAGAGALSSKARAATVSFFSGLLTIGRVHSTPWAATTGGKGLAESFLVRSQGQPPNCTRLSKRANQVEFEPSAIRCPAQLSPKWRCFCGHLSTLKENPAVFAIACHAHPPQLSEKSCCTIEQDIRFLPWSTSWS